MVNFIEGAIGVEKIFKVFLSFSKLFLHLHHSFESVL